MKLVLAPDSFKDSLTSIQVSEVISRAIRSVNGQIQIVEKPMADGGEGTLDALSKAVSHNKVAFSCTGPLGDSRESWYAELDNQLAVIEGANISGLPLVPEQKRNPDYTTSYGIGEAIRHALDRGHRNLIIAIGGSSTNDGGLGMLQALGMKAYDKHGKSAGIFGRDLHMIERLDFSSIDPRLRESTIRVASDVDNPLTGKRGASHIYGPQKGATHQQVLAYDQSLAKYGRLVESACGKQLIDCPGAGAAGGLGFAFLSINARLQSGAKLVAEAIGLREVIKEADYVISGEGQSDSQTLSGKAPGYVAELANEYGKPVILLSGSLEELEQLNQLFTSCFSIVPGPKSLAECIDNAESYLYQASRQIARIIF